MFSLCTSYRSAALAALLFFFLAGCEPATPPEQQFSGPVMGTEYHVKIIAAVSEGDLEALRETIRVPLEEVDRLMSTYKPESELSRFNASKAGQDFQVSDELAEVVECALEVSRQTDGAFDVTVGPLVNAWGFGPKAQSDPPPPETIQRLLEEIGYAKLHVEGNVLRKDRDALACDLSAVAKGYAVDQAVRAIEGLGYTRYMVEVGGEVRAAGLNKNDTAWRIAIEKPDAEARAIQRIVALGNDALATSGDYRNFITVEGERRSHTIDPVTGSPVTHTLASASVIHSSCMWADAYATALMAMGPERARAFAQEQGLAVFLILHGESASFEEWASPQFEPYVHAPVGG